MFPVKQTNETISASPVLEIVSDLQLDGKENDAETLLEEISLPPLEGITIDGILKAGDTLYESLIREGISAAEILDLQDKIKSVVDFNYIPAGSKYSLKYDPKGTLKEFTYEPTPFDVFHISLPIPNSDLKDLKVVKEDIPKEIVQIEGTIKSSLYESMIECADAPQLAIQMAEIFAWEIDFLTECREGDTFKIIVEKQYKGDFYRWEKILAAQYEGELLSKYDAVLFEDPSGNIDYYTKEGKSLRKAFLKAPLNYKYISSYFTNNRLHPILRIWRPHLAIDYAAPSGTPVSAIGDGTVIYKGWNDGYGNYIKIRHPNNYETGYGHLSRFASGLKKGQKVKQGEIIGYVGATGLATGPHLDFSISENGKKVDFLKLKLPSASSINPQYITQFNEVKNKLLSALENREELDLNLEFKDLYSNGIEGE
ncbi:MAG: M23 family metallopeptidase [Candidatus Atribacteria bacterium]|nr:M23 family metallopeptidase [Candidatus Atribacteria bacterium]